MEGLVESMLYEVNAWNIGATIIVSPGMRDDTDRLQSSDIEDDSVTSREKKKRRIEEVAQEGTGVYGDENSPAKHVARVAQWMEGRQPVSMVRSAELIWQLGHCKYPPLRLLLGMYAVETVRDRLRCVIEEVSALLVQVRRKANGLD
jgi:hypothetical protein